MSVDARKALHELREYFEQKRNLAIRMQGNTSDLEAAGYELQAACYDHAMAMVASYIRQLPK